MITMRAYNLHSLSIYEFIIIKYAERNNSK